MKLRFAAVYLVLSGCTSTQVHWDAVQMRENVIDYYNDEIMDNLIRARNSQPFVHVDVGSLQALTSSKLAGAVGDGQTITNTDTRALTNQTVTTNTTAALPSRMVAGTVGIVGTAAHMAMRPFTVSVAPERSDTLTINSIPAVGEEAKSIYDCYFNFLNLCSSKNPDCARRKGTGHFSYLEYCDTVRTACTIEEQLRLPRYVPGTLKRRGGCLYYVPWFYREDYLDLCKNLLTAQRSGKALLVPSGPSLIAP
ncbi:MAG TPA: hypothetical protein VH227_06495 [Candidatus Udaeobacter sp.]|jgi:hypothetical protein|nr:hypothetical protein [Candidatus Udaeobacter sp.]